MKRSLLVFSMMLAFIAFANAQDTVKDKKFEFSVVESYDLSGIMPNKLVEEIGVDYKFPELGAVGLCALSSNNDGDRTWGLMARISTRPQLGNKFSFVPSIGIGFLRGFFDGMNTKTRAAATIGVEARYNVTDAFFCGFQLTALTAGNKSYYNTMLLGVKLGIAF